MQKMITSQKSAGLSASLCSIVTNFVLASVKLMCGIFCSAPSLISDAIHSAADLFSTVIVLIGMGLSAKSPDKHHPYGHERIECIASILLAGILLATGILIGSTAASEIASGSYLRASPPQAVAVIVALFSIIAKLALSRYIGNVARRIRSTALRADSLHQITDAFASLGALCGIIAAMLGFSVFELLASILIALFLLESAFSIFKEASIRLIDRSAGETLEEELSDAVRTVGGVVSVEKLYTRLFGSRIYVEAELLLDANLTLSECMPIILRAKETILASHPEIKGCTVTVAPWKAYEETSGFRQKP